MNTTMSNQKSDEITFDDMLKAVKLLPKKPRFEKLEVNKKQFNQLNKELVKQTSPFRVHEGIMGNLYGVEVKVRPYLKKARMYFRKP